MYKDGKINYHTPVYHYLRTGPGGMKNDVIGTGSTGGDVITYDVINENLSEFENLKFYKFEILDGKAKIINK